jgi:phosphoserine phosphatase
MSSLAVVFDFDDTLVPDSTTRLLRANDIEPKEFWESLKPLVRAGYDPTLAFLNSFLDKVGEAKPLGPLTNADLRTFGGSLNKSFFPGLPGLFRDLRATAAKSKVEIEFYVISGGLQEIIEGTEPVKRHFTGVYGCQLDEQDGVLRRIKRCITFTEKTRYMFEISKGITPEQARRNPYVVNKDVPARPTVSRRRGRGTDGRSIRPRPPARRRSWPAPSHPGATRSRGSRRPVAPPAPRWWGCPLREATPCRPTSRTDAESARRSYERTSELSEAGARGWRR